MSLLPLSETDPMSTKEAVEESPKTYAFRIDQMPSPNSLREIDEVDIDGLERLLMEEGIKNFVERQKALFKLIGRKRTSSRHW